ncbi:hypothetical protein D3C83_18680 [compost metagenome]
MKVLPAFTRVNMSSVFPTKPVPPEFAKRYFFPGCASTTCTSFAPGARSMNEASGWPSPLPLGSSEHSTLNARPVESTRPTLCTERVSKIAYGPSPFL